MKKLLLSLIACCSFAMAQAQAPNSVLLYTDLGYSSSKQLDTSSLFSPYTNYRNWSADIGIGIQFNENWTVGLNLGFSQQSARPDSGNIDRLTENNYRLGPFLRYSHYIAGSKTFFWFAQFNAQYQGGYTKWGDVPTFGKHSGYAFNVMPALGANFGKNWCLNFSIGSLGYSYDKYKDDKESTHSFDFMLGRAFHVGVSKNFGGSHMKSHRQPMDDTRNVEGSDDDDSSRKKSRKDDDE